MGEAGLRWVTERFGQERMVRQTLAVYDRHMAESPGT